MSEDPTGEPGEDRDARWSGDGGTPLGHQGTRAGEGLPVPGGAARAFGVVKPADTSDLASAREEEAELWRRRRERAADPTAADPAREVLANDGRELLNADVDVLASIAEADARSRVFHGLAWAVGIYLVTSSIALVGIWRAGGSSAQEVAAVIAGFGGIVATHSPEFAFRYIGGAILIGIGSAAAAFAGAMFSRDWRWGLWPVLALAGVQTLVCVPILFGAQPEPPTPGALLMGLLLPMASVVFGALFGAGVGGLVTERV